MKTKTFLVVLGHGLVGWMLCAATMFVGMATTTIDIALVVHAVAAPVFFALVSYVYARYFNYTAPLSTAVLFLVIVIAVDFVLVAVLINRSLEMFTSMLGTWIPFALIFLSTYVTLSVARRHVKKKVRGNLTDNR